MKMRVGTFNSPTFTGAASFDTGLGATPQAVLFVTAGIAEGAVTRGQMSSFGATDGISQWVSSLVIPWGTANRPNKVSQEFPLGGGVSTTRCIYTHNASRVAELDASIASLNSDGTVTMDWAAVQATGRAVGFAAFADLPHAKCGTIALDPGGVGNSPLDFTGLTFLPKQVWFSGCWFDEAGNTFNEASNNLGHMGVRVDAPDNPGTVLFDPSGGVGVFNNNTVFDVLYPGRSGNPIAMRRQWTCGTPDAQGFTLTRVGAGPIAQTTGYLALGGDDWHMMPGAEAPGFPGGGPAGDIDETMKCFGGYRLGAPDAGGVAANAEGIPGNERLTSWFGFYDELENQFVMILYGENDDDLNGSMDGMFSAFYSDRVTGQIDGVFGTAALEAFETLTDVPSRGEPTYELTNSYLDIQPFLHYSLAFVTWAPTPVAWKPQIIRHHAVRRSP